MRTGVIALAVALAFAAGHQLGGSRGAAAKAAPSPLGARHVHGSGGHTDAAAEPVARASREGPAAPWDPSDEVCAPGLGAPVRLSSEQQQLIGIRISTVQRAAGVQPVRLFGRVAPDERRVYTLNSGADGFIREVSSATTGSRVRQGDVLAAFSSPELRPPLQALLVTLEVLDRAKANEHESPAQMAAARVSIQVAVDRLLNLGVSQAQIDEIAKHRTEVPASLKITSPVDGFVLARNVSAGQKFTKGTEWYRVANLDRVWLVVDLYESDASHFKPGLQAKVMLNGRALPAMATVSEVLPQFDPVTRTLKVRLDIDNTGHLLRPDMAVDLVAEVQRGVVTMVPAHAVVDSGLQKVVYVERGSGLFEPRVVETGVRLGQHVEVLKGLKAGERVVSAGTFLLDSESRMRASTSGAVETTAVRPEPVPLQAAAASAGTTTPSHRAGLSHTAR